MDLLLEIISHQRHAMPEEQSKFVFKAAGGTIGRNQDNDWSIDDPERLISGQHAAIHFDNNHFIILDHSTNGLFINQNQNALGEQQHIIINGDVFLIGQYSIQATLIATQSQAVFSSSSSMHSANQASYQDGSQFNSQENAHQPAIPLHSGLSNDNPISLLSHEQPQNLNQLVDPMNQFNDESLPGRLAEQDILSQNDPVNSLLDPIPSTQSYFDLPNAIPENWLNNRADNNSEHEVSAAKVIPVNEKLDVKAKPFIKELPTANKKPKLLDIKKNNQVVDEKLTDHVGDFEDFKNDFMPGSSNEESNPNVEKPALDDFLSSTSDVSNQITNKPDQNKEIPNYKDKISQSAQIHESSLVEADNNKAIIPKQTHVLPNNNINPLNLNPSNLNPSKNIAQTPAQQNAINILLTTLGIDPADISEEQLPELTKNIALIAKYSMSGTMKTMMSRAHLKNEFRMSMTTIKTQENNPLKFCINYEQLVHYMLVKPMAGYLDAEQAVKESFEELQEHQIGVMAGMKSSLNYILEKLSPEKIIEKSERAKSLGLGSKKSRYWDVYNELHQDINDEEDIFSTFFGNEFCKAYERQINDIRQAKK